MPSKTEPDNNLDSFITPSATPRPKAGPTEEELARKEENILFQEACRSSYFSVSLPRTQAMQLQYVVWGCVPIYWPYHVTANKGLRSKGLVRWISRGQGDPIPFEIYAEITEAGAAVFELLVLAKMAQRRPPLDEVLTKIRHERIMAPKSWEKYVGPWLERIGYNVEATLEQFRKTYGVKG